MMRFWKECLALCFILTLGPFVLLEHVKADWAAGTAVAMLACGVMLWGAFLGSAFSSLVGAGVDAVRGVAIEALAPPVRADELAAACHCDGSIAIPPEGATTGCGHCGCTLTRSASGLVHRSCDGRWRSRLVESWASRSPGDHGAEERAFLVAIASAPEDLTARLVYADWLDERGDPRAELLRAVCEWAALPASSERERTLREQIVALREEFGANPLWVEWVDVVGIPGRW